jgi:hypothetical protein
MKNRPKSNIITFVLSNSGLERVKSSHFSYFLDTELAWIYQTYLELRTVFPEIDLSNRPPDIGLFIAHDSAIPGDFVPSSNQIFVSVTADGPRHRGADVYVCQNRHQSRRCKNGIFIPHWPEKDLIFRHFDRQERFENIFYFGDRKNLDPAFSSTFWKTELAERKLNWIVVDDPERSRDYSDVDCVIAIRSFSKNGFARKPASKLVNSTIAGVPAICGNEIAFREFAKPGSGYLEASNIEQTLQHIDFLKNSPKERTRLIQSARSALNIYSRDAVRDAWIEALRDFVTSQPGNHRQIYKRLRFLRRRLVGGINHRLALIVGNEHNVF